MQEVASINCTEKIFGKVAGKISRMAGASKEDISLSEQDIRILENDLNELESSFPDRRDVVDRARLLIKDNNRYRELLGDSCKFKEDGKVENLILMQMLEYEKDTAKLRSAAAERGRSLVQPQADASPTEQSYLGKKLQKSSHSLSQS